LEKSVISGTDKTVRPKDGNEFFQKIEQAIIG
jgi:hypothetical protein